MIVVLLVIGAVVAAVVVARLRHRSARPDPVIGLTYQARPRELRHKPVRVYVPKGPR